MEVGSQVQWLVMGISMIGGQEPIKKEMKQLKQTQVM